MTIEQIRPTLSDFYRVADAIKNGHDLGNALPDGVVLALNLDSQDNEVDLALLYLDMAKLTPFIMNLRRRFIECALEELDAEEKP